MNYLKLIILVVVSALPVTTFAVQPTGESGNPFNNLMSPSGGVNLYSGDVVHTQPLFVLGGRNGMNLSIAMNYSSNINLNARSRNDKAPTGWCGLGWQLGFGSIVSDHKGTRTYDDDDFYLKTASGSGSQILKKDGKYFIKNDPYSKVEPISDASNAVIGWILNEAEVKLTNTFSCQISTARSRQT